MASTKFRLTLFSLGLIFSSPLLARSFVGGGVSVGQSSLVGGRSSGLTLGYQGEIGLKVPVRPFQAAVASIEFNHLLHGYRDNKNALSEMDLATILFKAGFANELNEKVSIIWGIGIGPTLGDYTASLDEVNISSSQKLRGLSLRFGVDAELEISPGFYATTSLGWLFTSLDVASIKISAGNGSVEKNDYEGTKKLNTPELLVGLRKDIDSNPTSSTP